MALKPYITAPSVFEGGDLRKFNSSGLNRSRTFSGGGSGFRSESRKESTDKTKFKVEGSVIPALVVKTTIHYTKRETFEAEVNGEKVIGIDTKVKVLSQPKYIDRGVAFTTMPFTFKVVYTDDKGKTMTITNTNIR